MSDFRPAEVFPLRDFVTEEIAARGWSMHDLAFVMGYSLAEVEAVLRGEQEPDREWSLALSLALGTSAELWKRILDQGKGTQ